MVLVDFLRKFPNNKFDLLYFHHGTECCEEAFQFLQKFSEETGIRMISGKISRGRRPDESQEEYWRKERYSFLEKFSDEPILMAHHLNDVIETWTMTAFRGEPKIIPLQNKRYNILRPMLCVPKRDIEDWSRRHDVKHVFDRSNNDTSIRRNYIRHVMMKDIYHISPGIETVLKKKIEAEYKKTFSLLPDEDFHNEITTEGNSLK